MTGDSKVIHVGRKIGYSDIRRRASYTKLLSCRQSRSNPPLALRTWVIVSKTEFAATTSSKMTLTLELAENPTFQAVRFDLSG
jgi:hypothetical protein